MSRGDAIRRDGPIADDELDGLFGGLAGRLLALAVSGGADSMALLHLVARWMSSPALPSRRGGVGWSLSVDGDQPQPKKPTPDVARPSWLAQCLDADQIEGNGGPPPVVVLTIDHGLRPGSAADAAFVADEAGKLGLPCQILRWEGDKPTTGIQEAAREARRRLMFAVVEAERAWGDHLLARGERDYRMQARSLVMAHHADDQAETFLMRLARGSGLDGLSAMRGADRTTALDPTSGLVCRPLLRVPGARLRATLQAAALPWREDPSNADEHFERIRVRKALDVLGTLGIGATEIAASAARLGAARDGYLSLIADGPARAIDWHDGLMAEIDIGLLPSDVRVRILGTVLVAMGGASAPARLSRIETLAERIAAGAADETLGGCQILADAAGKLRVWRETGRGLPTADLHPGEGMNWDGGRFFVSLAADAPVAPVTVAALGAQGWADLKRAVPQLAELRIAGRRPPAAAVAGLPAFRAGARLLAVPCLAELLLRSGTDGARRSWAEAVPASSGHYGARFAGRDWLGRPIG